MKDFILFCVDSPSETDYIKSFYMKKNYLLILLLTQIGFSQAPAIEWQKSFGGANGDAGSSIRKTADGGYIVFGNSNSSDGDVTNNHGSVDTWLVKLSSTGAIQWQKTFGGSGFEWARDVLPTNDNGYILLAYSSSLDGDITSNHGGYDAWIVKIDSVGAIQWQKTIGGTDDEELFNILITLDGGYIIAGHTSSNNGDVTGNHGLGDGWVLKLDSTGTIEWQKTYGGAGDEYLYGIRKTTDGGYIVVGSTTSNDGNVSGNHGLMDGWVLKIDSVGGIEWQTTLGGTSDDFIRNLQLTPDGNLILVGSTTSTDGDITSNHGSRDVWVVKLSGTGGIQWQKTLGGTNFDIGFNIQLTSNNGYIISGSTNSNNADVSGNHGNYDAWIVRLSDTGTIQWQKTLGGTDIDYGFTVQPTDDGGFILMGVAISNDGDVSGNHGGQDIWIVKLEPELLTTAPFTNQKIKLYPNPTTDVITIQNPESLIFEKIIVVDQTGKIVLEYTENTNQVDVTNLANGIYILQAFSGEEKFTTKFVKL